MGREGEVRFLIAMPFGEGVRGGPSWGERESESRSLLITNGRPALLRVSPPTCTIRIRSASASPPTTNSSFRPPTSTCLEKRSPTPTPAASHITSATPACASSGPIASSTPWSIFSPGSRMKSACSEVW